MTTGIRCIGVLVFLWLALVNSFAGGSGLNVVVIVNTNSANSLQLGNHYCEQRQVPPQNVLRIGWTNGSTSWARTNFDARVRAPLNALLASRQLTNQIEFVLLSMDIPYRVTEQTGATDTSGINSTTAVLFYGFKADGCTTCPAGYPSCNLPSVSSNSYAGSEDIYRQTPPISAASNSWLAMMLTSSNLAEAKAIVDRGVASDSSFPTQSVYLIHYEGDTIRGMRDAKYDDSIFDNRLRGAANVIRVDASSPNGLGYQFGSQFGLSIFNLSPGLFAPGAMADNLTSYGGYLFDTLGQIIALKYLAAGATASYGTVVEPCAYYEKFPSPRNYFYQARGFSIAECYYQSLTNPFQGILVGEPLAAPFARPAAGGWNAIPAGAVLAGTTNLGLHFEAADASRPVQQVDLFVDGNYTQTLTNLPPRVFNVVYVTLNGFQTNYTVPLNASLRSVASNLTLRLNRVPYANATKVQASAHGDRIELRITDPALLGSQCPLTVSNYIGSATLQTTRLSASGTNFLDTPAAGVRSVAIGGTMVIGDYLQLTVTKTNGSTVNVAVTNSSLSTTLDQFVQQFMNAINANAALQTVDGLRAQDFSPSGSFQGGFDFNLRARTPGLAASQIQALVLGTFDISPVGAQTLDENLSDLQPRQHLYLAAGLTNVAFDFPLNTTSLADGFHELTAVAYEGSHVRTQKRVAQTVRVQNSPLAAVFTCLLCDTNSALEATLQFSVAANTNTISRLELFSTGGSWGTVSNQAAAVFSVAATNLGAGLHPFYAIVTRNDGQQYRTETKWIRLNETDAPFAVAVTPPAPTLIWPATAGRRYEVLSATNPAGSFVLRDSVLPTNSPGQWAETNHSAGEQYYRVRTAP